MRLQSAQNGCGPSTVANILAALGFRTPQGELASEDWVAKKVKLAQAMNDPHPGMGTIEWQIRRCLESLKVPHFQVTTHDPNVGVSALRGFMVSGKPCMLAVDNDEHWIAVTGVLGERFSIVDSADSELNVFLNGADLAQRWASASDPPKFYAIVVSALKKK
jgi:hypothetical protein